MTSRIDNQVKSQSFWDDATEDDQLPGKAVLAFGLILPYHLQLVSRR
jgi:hypothetical protein